VKVPYPAVALAILASLSLSGCFILESASNSASAVLNSASRSVESISDSVTGGGHASYRQDVKAYACAFAVRGGDERDFLRGLSRVASRYGITRWEEEPQVLLAAGQGLREGGLDDGEMEALESRLGAIDARTARLVMQGYRNQVQ
jgi:hypothetical protein